MGDEKKAAREKFKAVRGNYPDSWLEEQSRLVCAHITSWTCFAEARAVMGYLAFGKETPVDDVLRAALAQGKQVFVPHIAEDNVLQAVELKDFSELAVGRYGIRTLKQAKGFADPMEIGLVLVPGVAFTKEGGRLGMGGGYYDRFLPLAARAVLAGVALTPQITQVLPRAGHDAAVDFLVSEAGIMVCREN